MDSASLAAALARVLIHAATEIVDELSQSPDWDGLRGRIERESKELDARLLDAERQLANRKGLF